MKFSRLEAIGLLGLMFAAFAACEYLPFMPAQPPPPQVEVTATPTPSATPAPTPTAIPEPKKRRRRKHARGQTPASEGSPTPSGEASPAVSSVITTGESDQARGEIERTIKSVETRLSAISRDRLNSQEAADYDQIKSFVAEARSALNEQDDLRAHSLADKAARLIAQLVGRVSSP